MNNNDFWFIWLVGVLIMWDGYFFDIIGLLGMGMGMLFVLLFFAWREKNGWND